MNSNWKSIATGLVWFSAGVAISLFFTLGKGQKWIEEATTQLIPDDPISEDDLREAVQRVESQFNHAKPAQGAEAQENLSASLDQEIEAEFNQLASGE